MWSVNRSEFTPPSMPRGGDGGPSVVVAVSVCSVVSCVVAVAVLVAVVAVFLFVVVAVACVDSGSSSCALVSRRHPESPAVPSSPNTCRRRIPHAVLLS
jgi:hypothetical protein